MVARRSSTKEMARKLEDGRTKNEGMWQPGRCEDLARCPEPGARCALAGILFGQSEAGAVGCCCAVLRRTRGNISRPSQPRAEHAMLRHMYEVSQLYDSSLRGSRPESAGFWLVRREQVSA